MPEPSEKLSARILYGTMVTSLLSMAFLRKHRDTEEHHTRVVDPVSHTAAPSAPPPEPPANTSTPATHTDAEPEIPLLLPSPRVHAEDAQILHQHKPGWVTPAGRELVVPTYAPVAIAFGLVFLALGVVTMWPLSVLGALVFLYAISKWMGELLHD